MDPVCRLIYESMEWWGLVSLPLVLRFHFARLLLVQGFVSYLAVGLAILVPPAQPDPSDV